MLELSLRSLAAALEARQKRFDVAVIGAPRAVAAAPKIESELLALVNTSFALETELVTLVNASLTSACSIASDIVDFDNADGFSITLPNIVSKLLDLANSIGSIDCDRSFACRPRGTDLSE